MIEGHIMERNPKKKRRGRRRRRRRNPKWRPDTAAAVGLGVVGAGVGLISTLATSAARKTWTRLAIGTAAGAAAGAVLGATLPKGRASNPRRRAIQNPVGVTTAVGAGIVLALIPVAVAAKRLPVAARSMPPTVRGKVGAHNLDVFRQGPTWGWRAPSADMAGAGDTRRDAILNAYSDLVTTQLEPGDRIVLDFYPEQFQVQIVLSETGLGPMWRWSSSSTGEGGDADSRGDALLQALDWVDDHSQLA